MGKEFVVHTKKEVFFLIRCSCFLFMLNTQKNGILFLLLFKLWWWDKYISIRLYNECKFNVIMFFILSIQKLVIKTERLYNVDEVKFLNT